MRRIWRRDHPRIRGTNGTFVVVHAFRIGSSPHTRDKCVFHHMDAFANGIIPAYAGQIDKAVQNQIIRRDHPRIRGTNKIVRELSWHEVGSSPHTRDKYAKGGEIAGWRRIIPAYAGQI